MSNRISMRAPPTGALASLFQIADRTVGIAPLLKVDRQLRRDLCSTPVVRYLFAQPDPLMPLLPLGYRPPFVPQLLIQRMTKTIPSGRRPIRPGLNPRPL